ncbi:TIGR02285 family protein [Maridesulfovibrio sp.]|uniref:TIGR02285 family protein n=1 Tax=Maridesulfovibrio sp. TaxID=2795000 RepID=UPI0029CA8E35|nr:TIGR02285 family protein [Maridesulfovibrio sp.]
MAQRIFILVILILPVSGFCADHEINWYHANFPPMVIEKGDLKGKGFGEKFEKALQQKLANYKHYVYSANYHRIIKQIKDSNSCCIALLKTPEREKFIKFSKPVLVSFPVGVCILESRLPEFMPYIDKSGKISITKLFKISNMKLGISAGRSYTATVDKIIKNNPDSTHIITQYDNNIAWESIIDMMDRERVDYIIEYPHLLTWTQNKHNIKSRLKYIPIKEIGPFLLTYVGCSKNEWGEKVISQIDQILKGKCRKQCNQDYRSYLAPDEKIRHSKLVQQMFPTELTD